MSDDATNKISISTDSSLPLKKCWGVTVSDKEHVFRCIVNGAKKHVLPSRNMEKRTR